MVNHITYKEGDHVSIQFSSVQSLSFVWLFVTPWTAAHQASLSITNSWSLLYLSSRWCNPTISSSVVPFSSCPQSLPASGSFQMSQFFLSGGQSIGASTSASLALVFGHRVESLWYGSWFHGVGQGCGPCDQFGSFSVTVVFILFALWWRRIRGLWKLPDGRNWLWGKLGLVLMGRAMFSKSLTQLKF